MEEGSFQHIDFLKSNNEANVTILENSHVSRSINILIGITNKSYFHIHNHDYEYEYKLHLKHTKCSLTYRESFAKTETCASRTSMPKASIPLALNCRGASLK